MLLQVTAKAKGGCAPPSLAGHLLRQPHRPCSSSLKSQSRLQAMFVASMLLNRELGTGGICWWQHHTKQKCLWKGEGPQSQGKRRGAVALARLSQRGQGSVNFTHGQGRMTVGNCDGPRIPAKRRAKQWEVSKAPYVLLSKSHTAHQFGLTCRYQLHPVGSYIAQPWSSQASPPRSEFSPV